MDREELHKCEEVVVLFLLFGDIGCSPNVCWKTTRLLRTCSRRERQMALFALDPAVTHGKGTAKKPVFFQDHGQSTSRGLSPGCLPGPKAEGEPGLCRLPAVDKTLTFSEPQVHCHMVITIPPSSEDWWETHEWCLQKASRSPWHRVGAHHTAIITAPRTGSWGGHCPWCGHRPSVLPKPPLICCLSAPLSCLIKPTDGSFWL